MSCIILRSVVLGAFVAGSIACTFASPTSSTYNAAADQDGGLPNSTKSDPSAPVAADGGAAACTAPFTAPDLSTLTACGTGGDAHCYDADKVGDLGNLTACPTAGKVCVPDAILSANGKKLATCNSVVNTPGACVSTVMPDVAANAAQLTKDTCTGADEKCIPCVNPLNMQPTPFCVEVGARASSCGSPAPSAASDGGSAAPLPTCCTHTDKTTGGVCVPNSVVPAAQLSSALQDTCATATKCVPADFVANKPKTCSSLAGITSGVCLDKCFSSTLSDLSVILDSNDCSDEQVCVPCFVAKDEGLPGCQ
jgi:hypothetical protein